MINDTGEGPVWPPGDEWPAGMMPPPTLTLEISAIELEEVIRHHDNYGAAADADHDHETELYHKARASYLRQRLGQIAPHRLTPDRRGTA